MVNALIRPGVALALALVALRPVAAQVPLPEQPVADLDASAPMADLPDMEGLSPEAASPADTPAAVPETPDTRTGTVRYRTELAGLAAAGIEARFATLSKLGVVGETENLAQIDRRARSDLATIEALMRAAGFYAAEISFSVTPATVTGERAAVRIVVEPGERYLFSSIDIGVDPGPVRDLSADLLGLKTGEPVDSFAIEAAEARLGNGLRQNGYPFARVGDRDLLVDHDARAIAYTLKLAPGLRARFGEIRLDNRRLMGPKHVVLLSRFKPGDLFDAEKVEDFRRAMVATGLFSTVIARPVPTEAANEGDQIVDIAVATQPAPPRTLSGQGGYSTGEGFRIEAGWQHRALIRPEGALTVRGILGTEEQRLAGEVRFSNFRRRDNSLLLRSELSHEDRSAYTARTFSLGGRFERTTNLLWQKLWTWSFGGEFITTDETDTDILLNISRRRTFVIAAVPAMLTYDASDDLLNPSRGFRLAGRISPEASFQDSAFGYVRGQIDASGYVPLRGDAIVAAGRVRFGSIAGASRDRIAPSRRFYAGGGGSVRGFGYQDIGPRDVFNDPIGGRSVTEIAAELRFRVFGDFGIVPFVDGGQLYTSTVPRFNSLRVAAGVGLRYYSTFGPIRIDVATPINRQPGDSPVAVNVSIGQAF